jgi:protein SCO1/2
MIRVVLFALALLLAAAPAGAQQFDPFNEAKIDEKPGAAIPLDIRFRDAGGRPVTLQQLADGKPLLLVPVLHECPNFCGVTLAGLVDAIRALPAEERFATVAFGIDPKEGPREAADDLARLEAQTGQALPASFHAVTGEQAAIHEVADALGYRYAWDARIGQYAHAAAFAVITPQGRLSRWFYGLSPDPAELAKAIEVAREDKLGGWASQLLLVCFHYDPESGKYTPAITKMLRLAGLATVLGLALTIILMRRRHA